MAYSSKKPTPRKLPPAVEQRAPRQPDVTVPIDIGRLSELLDESTPPPGEIPAADNEFLSEEKAAGEPVPTASAAPAAEVEAEFDADDTSDGSSIAEALIKATGASHGAVGEAAAPGGGPFAARPGGESDDDELLARAGVLEADGDLDGAFELLRRAHSTKPSRGEVGAALQRLGDELTRRASERIGDLQGVPEIAPNPARARNLPPRKAFLLAQIDGQKSFEKILAVSGMPRDDGLRTFAQLLDDGLISVKER